MPIAIKCYICFSSYTQANTRVFPCGHSSCASCLGELNARSQNLGGGLPLCHMCREPFEPEEALQVFLELQGSSDEPAASQSQIDYPEVEVRWRDYSEEVQRQMVHIITGVEQVGADSTVKTIQRTGNEFRKMGDAMRKDRGEPDQVQALLRTIAGFTDRIAPVFARAASLREKLKVEIDRRKESDEKLKQAEKEVEQRDVEGKLAVDMAERTSAMLKDKQREIEAARAQLGEVQSEVYDRMATIRRQKEKEQRQAVKIADLMQRVELRDGEIRELRERLADYASTRATSEDLSESERQDAEDISEDDLWIEEQQPEPSQPIALGEDASELDFAFDVPSEPTPSVKRQTRDAPLKPKIKRPTFESDWTLDNPQKKKRRVSSPSDPNVALFSQTLGLDKDGRPSKGSLQLGDRSRRRFV